MVRLMCIVLVSLLSASQTLSRPADNFLKRTYVGTKMSMPYRIFVPRNYDPSRKYPVILTLHGVAENGNEDSLQIYNQWRLAEVWAEDTNQARNPCFVVSPQCPTDSLWVNVDFFQTPNYSYSATPISTPLATALAVLDSVIRAYSIDTNRQYVTGISMGGFGTWYLMMKYPRRFAAGMPMAGSSDTTKAGTILSIPTWAYHGALDDLIPVKNTREMIYAQVHLGRACAFTNCVNGDSSQLMSLRQVDSAVSAGAKFLYSEWQSIGHWGYENLYNHPAFVRWTFNQVRSPAVGSRDSVSPGRSSAPRSSHSGMRTAVCGSSLSVWCAGLLRRFDINGRSVR